MRIREAPGGFPILWPACLPQRRFGPVSDRIARAMRTVLQSIHCKHEKNTSNDYGELPVTQSKVRVSNIRLASYGCPGHREKPQDPACTTTTRGESGVKSSAARAVSRQKPSASSIRGQRPFRINALARAAHERQCPKGPVARSGQKVRTPGRSHEGGRLASCVAVLQRVAAVLWSIHAHCARNARTRIRRFGDHAGALLWRRMSLAQCAKTRKRHGKHAAIMPRDRQVDANSERM